MSRRSILTLAAAALAWIVLAGSQASADSITLDLTSPNTDLGPFPSPYAHVKIDRATDTTATITFTGDTTGGFTYAFGAAQAIDVNVNATTFTVGPIVGGLLFTHSPPCSPLPSPCAGNVSQFGNFNMTLDNTDGFNDRFSTVAFGLTDSSGTWASASDVLIADDKGFRAAAHIFVTAPSCGDAACVTGFAGDGGLAPVPEPATLLLFASSVLGLGFTGRKRLFRGGPESDSR